MRHLLATLLALSALACNRAAPVADADLAAQPAGGAVTLWTDSTELFMEHPALIVGAPEKFAVHLTDLTDFAPLRSGRITLRFSPRDGGTPLELVQDAPRAPGIFGPAPSFSKPGIYDLLIMVESPQAHDTLRVPGLQVYGTAAEAPRVSNDGETGIAFLKEQQWKTPGFATAYAVDGHIAETIAAAGRITPADGHHARVTAYVAGILEVGRGASPPAPGERVTRGQQLALLTPLLGESGTAIAAARGALHEAQDEFDRAVRLYAAEAIPERRKHEAEIRLTAAREALAGFGDGSTRDDGRLVVRAPISGVIASRMAAPGGRVEAGAELFTIVDPAILWLDARVPAADAARVGASSTAQFRVPGSETLWRTSRTIAVGSIIDSVTRTVPVLYQLANERGVLKAGMHAQVAVSTGQRVAGLVVPSSAVLEEDGRSIVFVQPEGERFEKRVVALGGRDGTRSLVVAGLVAGERVVTGAAQQVRLASLSTAVPAHGHEH